MKLKLYNLQLNNQPVKTFPLLSAKKVLDIYPHKTIKDFLKVALVGQTHGIYTEEYRGGELRVKRIQ